jgi:hypothetical protein
MFMDPQYGKGNQLVNWSIVLKNHQEMPGTLLGVCIMIGKKVWKRKVSLFGQLVVGISGALSGRRSVGRAGVCSDGQTVGPSVLIKVIHQ